MDRPWPLLYLLRSVGLRYRIIPCGRMYPGVLRCWTKVLRTWLSGKIFIIIILRPNWYLHLFLFLDLLDVFSKWILYRICIYLLFDRCSIFICILTYVNDTHWLTKSTDRILVVSVSWILLFLYFSLLRWNLCNVW